LPLPERARTQTPRGIGQLPGQNLRNTNHIGDDKSSDYSRAAPGDWDRHRHFVRVLCFSNTTLISRSGLGYVKTPASNLRAEISRPCRASSKFGHVRYGDLRGREKFRFGTHYFRSCSSSIYFWLCMDARTLFDRRVHGNHRRARSRRSLTRCFDGKSIASLISALRRVFVSRYVEPFQLAVYRLL
jgi:hypothetical protein